MGKSRCHWGERGRALSASYPELITGLAMKLISASVTPILNHVAQYFLKKINFDAEILLV